MFHGSWFLVHVFDATTQRSWPQSASCLQTASSFWSGKKRTSASAAPIPMGFPRRYLKNNQAPCSAAPMQLSEEVQRNSELRIAFHHQRSQCHVSRWLCLSWRRKSIEILRSCVMCLSWRWKSIEILSHVSCAFRGGGSLEQSRVEQTRVEQGRVEETRADQSRLEQTRVDQSRVGQS